MRRAFFVVGSEGSGTYMLWNALQAAGCHAEGWHNGIHDDYRFPEMPDLLTIRRSCPHGDNFPDLDEVVTQLVRSRYTVDILFIVRDCYATWQSVRKRLDPADEPPTWDYRPQRKTLEFFGNFLTGDNPFIEFAKVTPVTYEAFCLSPGFRKWLFEDRLGLTNPADFEIKYANEKYYEKQ